MGSLSKKYESNGNPGIIANNKGDIGGKSYGSYQIIKSNLPSFLKNIKQGHPGIYNALSKHKVGSSGFDNAWKQLARDNPTGFEMAQHDYIKQTHYDPQIKKLHDANIYIDSNPVVANVLWSTAVQQRNQTKGIVQNALKRVPGGANGDPAKIITEIYNERSKTSKYFSGSSSSIKKSVQNRFKNEKADALAMLDQMGRPSGKYTQTQYNSYVKSMKDKLGKTGIKNKNKIADYILGLDKKGVNPGILDQLELEYNITDSHYQSKVKKDTALKNSALSGWGSWKR